MDLKTTALLPSRLKIMITTDIAVLLSRCHHIQKSDCSWDPRHELPEKGIKYWECDTGFRNHSPATVTFHVRKKSIWRGQRIIHQNWESSNENLSMSLQSSALLSLFESNNRNHSSATIPFEKHHLKNYVVTTETGTESQKLKSFSFHFLLLPFDSLKDHVRILRDGLSWRIKN